MPKKKTIKVNKTLKWLIVLLVSVILLFAVSMLLDYIAISKDKATFKKAENDVITVQSELEKTNPQMKTEINKFCSQDNEKFGGGNLNCIIELRSVDSYPKEEMLLYTKNNQSAVQKSGFIQTREPDYNSLFETGSVERKDSSYNCRIYYDSSIGPKTDKYNFVFRCVDQVQKFIYPEK